MLADKMVRTKWYGQNGTDKMVQTKCYADKMLLDKMVLSKWYYYYYYLFNATVSLKKRIAEWTKWHGQISMDKM